MTDFKNAVIFGLAIENSLNELTIDPNTALRNLNLIPGDFNKLRHIAGSDITSGIANTFQKLSGFNENLLLKLDSLQQETREYDKILDGIYTAEARRGRRRGVDIEGNLIVNGKFAGRTVNYRIFDEETSKFKTVPITTSINSVWDELGNVSKLIVLGQSLKISSTQPDNSPAKAFIKVGKLKNLVRLTKRRFLAEKATHKIAITIDGVDYYMYAIKNNPFIFTGNFKNISDSNLSLTTSDGSTINYVTAITNTQGQEIEVSVENQDNVDSLGNGSILKIYSNPEKITNLKLIGHEIEEIPPGVIFSNAGAIEVNLRDNSFTTFPNFKKQFPNFTKINISQDVNKVSNTGEAVVKMDVEFAELKSKIPNDIIELNCGQAFQDFDAGTSDSPLAPNEFNLAPFDKLEVLNLSRCGTGEGVGLYPTPAISTTVKTLKLNHNSYSIFDEATLPDNNSLEVIDFQDNESLRCSPVSPVHKFYLNGTYSDNIKSFNVATTMLGIPNLSSKLKLEYFSAEGMDYDGQGDSPPADRYSDERFQLAPGGISKFASCTALETLTLKNAHVGGPIPTFAGNTSLETLNLQNTDLINWGYDTPVSFALHNLGFPPSLRNFTYEYNRGDSDINSPTMTNELPTQAFLKVDGTSDTGFTPINFSSFTYKSNKVTGGVFPQISATTINIVGNKFTSLEQFPVQAASVLKKLEAQNNELNGEFDLDTLFLGNVEYELLEELNFSSNKFTKMAKEFVSNTNKFSVLKKLILNGAFDEAIADSPPTLKLEKFKNPNLEFIDVGGNAFDEIADNLFSGQDGAAIECDGIKNFIIDENDFVKVQSMIDSIKRLQLGKSTLRTFSFASGATTRLDIRIPNYNGKRSFTSQEQSFFSMHEDITLLKDQGVTISGIQADLNDAQEAYPAVPEAPLNANLQRFIDGGKQNLRITFDFIENADRVIIKIHSEDTPNEEFTGNDSSTFDITVFNQTGGVGDLQTHNITDTRLLETVGADRITKIEIFGENTRSIIEETHFSREINLPPDSPPEYS